MTLALDPFNVVIAGFGWWGQHITNRLKDHPAIRVVAIVEPVLDSHPAITALGRVPLTHLAEAVKRSDVDGVILTTPNPLHEQQVILCANAGKHVFCEKPLGLTANSARRSLSACEDAGVQLGNWPRAPF